MKFYEKYRWCQSNLNIKQFFEYTSLSIKLENSNWKLSMIYIYFLISLQASNTHTVKRLTHSRNLNHYVNLLFFWFFSHNFTLFFSFSLSLSCSVYSICLISINVSSIHPTTLLYFVFVYHHFQFLTDQPTKLQQHPTQDTSRFWSNAR